jgi:hypothetical protein
MRKQDSKSTLLNAPGFHQMESHDLTLSDARLFLVGLHSRSLRFFMLIITLA